MDETELVENRHIATLRIASNGTLKELSYL